MPLPRLLLYAPPLDGANTRFRWEVLGQDGATTAAGEGRLAEVPKRLATWLVLPAAAVLMLRARLPRVSARRLADVLPYAVEDRALGDPEALHAVSAQADADGSSRVAVVDKQHLEGLLEALAAADVRVTRCTSLAEFLRPEPSHWQVLADVMGDGFTLLDARGESIPLDRGGDVPPAALQLALARATPPPDRITIYQPTPGSSALIDLAARWQQALQVSVQVQAPWEPWRGARAAERGIDLLAGGQMRARVASRWPVPFRLLRPALILAGAVLLAHGTATALHTVLLMREHEQLRAARIALFQGTFPQAAIVDPALQMRRNRMSLEAQAGIAGEHDLLTLLQREASKAGAPLARIDYDGQTLHVQRLQPTQTGRR
jgi:type II secretion system protein L